MLNLYEIFTKVRKDCDEMLVRDYLSGFYENPDKDERRRLRAMGVQV